MGIADDIKTLGEDIVASYDSRVKAIGTLVKDTHQMLNGFHAEHEKMAEEQAKSLADFVADLTKNVSDMLKKFQKEHKEMSVALSESLSNFVKDLTKDVSAMMKAIAKAHKEMADNLKESLEKGEVDRLKDFKAMMGNIKKGINDMEDYVAKKLKEFDDAHAEMSEQQKKDLAKYVAGIVAETKRVLRGFADESEKMAANWQAMAATMAKRRGGKPIVSAGAEVKTVEEAVKKPRKKGKKRGRKAKK